MERGGFIQRFPQYFTSLLKSAILYLFNNYQAERISRFVEYYPGQGAVQAYFFTKKGQKQAPACSIFATKISND